MYTSIEQIKEANKKRGYHYFDKEAIAFFNATIHPTIYHGSYFIEEHYYDEDSAIDFKIKKAEKDGSITTISTFQQYLTFAAAEQAVKDLKGDQSCETRNL